MAVLDCHTQSFRYSQVPVSNSAPTIKQVWVDKTFTANDKLAIDDAINEWNYVLNGTIILKVVTYEFDMEIEAIKAAMNSDGLLVMNIDSSNSMVDDATTAAWVNGVGGNKLYIVHDRAHTRLKKIMLHELGHALGAAHQDGFTLMAPKFDEKKYTCIDHATVKQVARFKKIRYDQLNYCIYLDPSVHHN